MKQENAQRLIKLAVSEVFSSIQGEGMTMGRPAVFLRLGGCNLMCGGMGTQFDNELHNGATWRCDTIEVWMKAQSQAVEDIFDQRILNHLMRGSHLVITGGEPLMQQDGLILLLKHLRRKHQFLPYVEIETNGTIIPKDELVSYVGQFNISPKLSNSGNDLGARYNEAALEFFAKQDRCDVQFKYVISSEDDYKEVLNRYIPIHGTRDTYLMPAGEDQSLLNETRKIVAEIAIRDGLNYSERLHIVIWDKKTGV